MVPPLFTATGLLLHQATIQAFEKKKQGICFYSALIAHPSTGKSPAAEVIKEAMVKVEAALHIPFEKSCMTNPATVEALVQYLDKIPCMMGKKAYYDFTFIRTCLIFLNIKLFLMKHLL